MRPSVGKHVSPKKKCVGSETVNVEIGARAPREEPTWPASRVRDLAPAGAARLRCAATQPATGAMNPFGDAPRAEPTRDRFGFALEDEELVELERGSAAVHNSTVLPRQRKAWAAIATVAEVAQGADVAAALKSMGAGASEA